MPGERAGLRRVLAPNASPLTLDGTWTHIVGAQRVAVIDPGSGAPEHLDAIARLVGDASASAILLTHEHRDHAEGAYRLAVRLKAPILAFARGGLADGQSIPTDAGELIAVAAPGHTPDHFAFWWGQESAVFCGDLMLGGQETSLVAAPEGDLDLYLASLQRIRRLDPRIIHPAHGPEIQDPEAAIARYVRHRLARENQVLAALRAGAMTLAAIADDVYGTGLDEALRAAACGAVRAYLERLERGGRVRRDPAGSWRIGGDRAGGGAPGAGRERTRGQNGT